MEGGLLLDVVIGEGTAIFQLLSSEDETLLVRGDTFLVLNLLLHSLDGIGGLDLEGDGLSGESLDEDLHGWFGFLEEENQKIRPFLQRLTWGNFSPKNLLMVPIMDFSVIFDD